MSHTPGPWDATASGAGQPLNRIGHSLPSVGGGFNSHCVALLPVTYVHSDAETSANARLIAAAPDLLETLKMALAQLEVLGGRRRKYPNEGQDELHADVLERVDAAIAKATDPS